MPLLPIRVSCSQVNIETDMVIPYSLFHLHSVLSVLLILRIAKLDSCHVWKDAVGFQAQRGVYHMLLLGATLVFYLDDHGLDAIQTVNEPDAIINIPKDLELACMKQVAKEWKRQSNSEWGQASKGVGDVSISINIDELLDDVKATLNRYRRL